MSLTYTVSQLNAHVRRLLEGDFRDLWVEDGISNLSRAAWLLLLLIAGHILMTVIHQHRGEKILQRMAGRRDHPENTP